MVKMGLQIKFNSVKNKQSWLTKCRLSVIVSHRQSKCPQHGLQLINGLYKNPGQMWPCRKIIFSFHPFPLSSWRGTHSPIVYRDLNFTPFQCWNSKSIVQLVKGLSLSGLYFRALMTVVSTTKATAHTMNPTDKCRGISKREGMFHLWVSQIVNIAILGQKATVQGPVGGCQGQQLRGKRVYVSGYRQLGPHM